MRKIVGVIGVLILVMVALYVAIPILFCHMLNKKLASIEIFRAHVQSVDLKIFQRELSLNGVTVNRNSKEFAYDVAIPKVIFHMDDPFKSSRRSQIDIQKPNIKLNLHGPKRVVNKTPDKKQWTTDNESKSPKVSFLASFIEQCPVPIDNVAIESGTVVLLINDEPVISSLSEASLLSMLNIRLPNLLSMHSNGGTAYVTSKLASQGSLSMEVQFNLASQPEFDMKVNVEQLDLPKVNKLLAWETGWDFKQGISSFQLESHAQQGTYKGTIRPYIENLNVKIPNGSKNVQLVISKVGQNPMRSSDGIPFDGQFQTANIYIEQAILIVVRNAFVESFRPYL